MSHAFRMPPRASRMRSFGGPSVWLEFSPLSKLVNAINLGQGFPGWGPPDFVKSSLREAVQKDDHSQYARAGGELQLVKQIAESYTPKLVPDCLKGTRVIDPLREVLVTVGASQALQVACQALLDVDDEVLLIEPAFDIYSGGIIMAGAKPVFVSLRPRPASAVTSSGDLVLDMQELADSITPRTRMLILNSPHNPTGKVFTKEEFEQIAELLDRKAPECIVISDEVYEHLVFEGEHVPFASVSPSAFERTLSVYSAGKTFSITGLKIGWIVGSAQLLRDLQIAQQFIVFSVSTQSQIAVADALRIADEPYKGEKNYYTALCLRYKAKRNFFVRSLREAGMSPITPQGAFYICTKVPEDHPSRAQRGLPTKVREFVAQNLLQIDPGTTDRSDYNICRSLAIGAGVVSIPVSAFYSPDHVGKTALSKSYARFAFCKPDDILEEAAHRLSTKRA